MTYKDLAINQGFQMLAVVQSMVWLEMMELTVQKTEIDKENVVFLGNYIIIY